MHLTFKLHNKPCDGYTTIMSILQGRKLRLRVQQAQSHSPLHLERSLLGLMLCYHQLKILNKFEQGALGTGPCKLGSWSYLE